MYESPATQPPASYGHGASQPALFPELPQPAPAARAPRTIRAWPRSARYALGALIVVLVLSLAGTLAELHFRDAAPVGLTREVAKLQAGQARLQHELTSARQQASAAQATADQQPGVLSHMGICYQWFATNGTNGGALSAVDLSTPQLAPNGTASCPQGNFIPVLAAPRP